MFSWFWGQMTTVKSIQGVISYWHLDATQMIEFPTKTIDNAYHDIKISKVLNPLGSGRLNFFMKLDPLPSLTIPILETKDDPRHAD